MTEEELDFFRSWFAVYTSSFKFAEEGDQKNIRLKERHTHEVCRNIVLIARGSSLADGKLMLAELIGLFHDVGRFPQYEKYKTFRDSISENHAALGASILSEKGILERLSEEERDLVLSSVKFHNALAMPDLANDEARLFLKLIRDADKLDIWRVFVEYYESEEEDRASAVGLGLPDDPGYSGDALSYIFKEQVAPLSCLRNLNDFKLTQLSWVFDLNFRETFRLLQERGYVDRILETMPRTDEIARVSSALRDYMERLNGKGPV